MKVIGPKYNTTSKRKDNIEEQKEIVKLGGAYESNIKVQ